MPKKIRILFLLNIDMCKQGPSVHLLNDIISECKKRGHHVTRIEKRYGSNSWKTEKCISDNEQTFYVECGEPRTFNYAKRYINDIKYAFKCKKLIFGNRFDVVFLQSCNTAAFQVEWLKHLNCPIVYNVQDIFPLDIYYEGVLNKYNPVYIAMDFLQNYAYRNSTKIITVSQDMKRTLESFNVSSNKITVVHNWSYQSYYDVNEELEVYEKYYNNGKFNVVYAGNIGLAQSVETLILAARLLQDCSGIKIMIFGAGSRRNKCEMLVKELNISNVIFYDLLPQQYSQYVYHLADINIVTLIRGIMNTSLPSKTAACYNSEKPVIYCIEKNSQTLLKMQEYNNNIYCCEPQDSEELAKLIKEIYQNKLVNDQNQVENKFKDYAEIMLPQSAKEYVNVFESFQNE